MALFELRNIIWVGARRQGKTLAMVRQLISAMKRDTQVYSNIQIRYHWKKKKVCLFSHYIKNGQEFLQIMEKTKNALFGIDEVGLFFPNQYWTHLSFNMLKMFKASGHVGVAFYGTTHTEGDIVGKLRGVVDDVILCSRRRWFGHSHLPYIKNVKLFFHILTHPSFHNLSRLFTKVRETNLGKHYSFNEVFKIGGTPAYIFRLNWMRKGYKGNGGARQFMNNLIRSESLYPCQYVEFMQSYDTHAWEDYSGMVKGDQTVSRRGRASYRNSGSTTNGYKRPTATVEQYELMARAERKIAEMKELLTEPDEKLPN